MSTNGVCGWFRMVPCVQIGFVDGLEWYQVFRWGLWIVLAQIS
jgi:hypothetical protein